MKKRVKKVSISSSEDELSDGEPSSPIKTTRRARMNVKYIVEDDDDDDDDVEQDPGDDRHDWMEVDDDDSDDSDFE